MDRTLLRMVHPEAEVPERRGGTDRRTGVDRRTIDLLRETGRQEHERRRGSDRRVLADRRRVAVRQEPSGCRSAGAPPAELVTPWQLA